MLVEIPHEAIQYVQFSHLRMVGNQCVLGIFAILSACNRYPEAQENASNLQVKLEGKEAVAAWWRHGFSLAQALPGFARPILFRRGSLPVIDTITSM